MQNNMVTLDSLSPNKRFLEAYINDTPDVLSNLKIVANTGWIHSSVTPNMRYIAHNINPAAVLITSSASSLPDG